MSSLNEKPDDRLSRPDRGALEGFFELLDCPAALCSPDFLVLKANAAFDALLGTRHVTGQDLRPLLKGLPDGPLAEHRHLECTLECSTGQQVHLSMSRTGNTVAVLAKQVAPGLGGIARALVEQARVESALLKLGRQVAGATGEEELLSRVADGVKGLFPGRAFCVRIIDPKTCALTSLYAEGKLKAQARDIIWLRPSALEKTGLDRTSLSPFRVKITPGELPLLFEGTARGIVAPLVASAQLFGAINMEYAPGFSADVLGDERILIQLANQVGVAVKNAKLIDELTFVRKYLEELLEHANALILVVDRDRRVVIFNAALEALTGLSRAAVLGQDVLSLIPEGEQLKIGQGLAAALAGHRPSTAESVLRGKNGREIRVAFATSALKNSSGEIEGVIAIGQDMTRMRELEKRVIHADRLASIGQLAASIVHEINNPMTAVVAYADALYQRAAPVNGLPSPDADKLKRIRENSERVLRFTQSLVSYARPPTEKPERVNLGDVLSRALEYCELDLSRHAARVERRWDTLPDVLGIKQNLVQAFVNLVTNACHASPRNATIEVGAREEAPSVIAWVTDHGAGITPELMERVFEPFYTTKPDGHGTGLGLSIVQSIVEKHGGRIDVSSEPGKGTTFQIRLPVAGVP